MFTEMLLGKQAKQAALDQQAAEFNAKQRQQNLQNIQQIGSQAMSLAKEFKDLKTEQSLNSSANSMMNQQDRQAYDATVGEDGYSDGSVPEPTNHTGGMGELKLSLAMDQNRRANLASNLSQQRYDLSQQRMDNYNTARQISAANAATRLVNQKDRDVINNSMAYFRNLGVYQKAVNTAIQNGDQNAYSTAAQNIQGLYHGVKSAGLNSIPEPQIPDFQAAIPEHTEGGIMGFFAKKVPAVPAIKAPAYNDSTSTLPNSQGYGTPSDLSINALRNDPSLASDFDAHYGQGASSQYLQ
jgi:hypothetical protein